ncbi:hypothetical protein [Carnobacterium sp. FSL W8-0810]|uniref:hypothetical protein n=1 Tax=Carnobacterium sp. FSL W8-0810 TaxID=2954705 RepID=UPI0030F614C7
MMRIFGKEYQKDSVLYFITFLCSIIIIFLNILFAVLFEDNIFNLNMLTGILLFFYSWKNLFLKKK